LKLPFDENLSPRLVELLAADFPGCTHIEFLGMRGTADTAM
jgi:predicted nuclease of predicted toxin-antitoxin system